MCAKHQRRCPELLAIREEAIQEWARAETFKEVRSCWARLGGIGQPFTATVGITSQSWRRPPGTGPNGYAATTSEDATRATIPAVWTNY